MTLARSRIALLAFAVLLLHATPAAPNGDDHAATAGVSAPQAASPAPDAPSAAAASAAAPDAPSPAAAYANDPAAVKRGRAIFIGTCGAYCHDLRGGTRGDVPDLFDCNWTHGGLDADIFSSIAHGVPGTRMVAFGDALPKKDEDVWKVVAFLRSQSKCAQTGGR